MYSLGVKCSSEKFEGVKMTFFFSMGLLDFTNYNSINFLIYKYEFVPIYS